jgi:hypothetical protein
VISFDGHAYFDHPEDEILVSEYLEKMLSRAEQFFKQKGHKIASEVVDEKPVKTK